MHHKKWATTIDEAVGVVVATLSDDERASIAALSKSELIGLHFGLGLWIRNNLGLWKGNEALMQAIRERDQAIHPDDASMVIVEAVWERLREMVPKVHRDVWQLKAMICRLTRRVLSAPLSFQLDVDSPRICSTSSMGKRL